MQIYDVFLGFIVTDSFVFSFPFTQTLRLTNRRSGIWEQLLQSLLIFWKYKYHALELDGSRTSFKDFFPCNSIFQCLEIHVIIFLRWRVFRIHCERITKWNDTFNLQNVKRNKNKVYLNILVFKLSGYVRKQTNFKLPWIQTKPNMWESDLSSLLGSAIVHNSEQTW